MVRCVGEADIDEEARRAELLGVHLSEGRCELVALGLAQGDAVLDLIQRHRDTKFGSVSLFAFTIGRSQYIPHITRLTGSNFFFQPGEEAIPTGHSVWGPSNFTDDSVSGRKNSRFLLLLALPFPCLVHRIAGQGLCLMTKDMHGRGSKWEKNAP